MIHPGKYNALVLSHQTTGGYMLKDEEGTECFIPNIFVNDSWQVGDEVEVFVYQDNNELKATTEIPLAEVGEYAVMECIETLPAGAFLDWGIIKDLFVPYKEQRGKMVEGKRYLVYVYIDEETGLITGTAKFKRNISYENLPFTKGQEVQLTLIGEGELGWNVVVEKKYLGLIYASDVYKKLYPLSEEKGYIKEIRKDGKLDITLQPTGFDHIDEFKTKILHVLERNGGVLYVSDASSPEDIKEVLEMSKKNFKKAIGNLYREKLIEISEDSIRLK